jgi:hypothetical protein
VDTKVYSEKYFNCRMGGKKNYTACGKKGFSAAQLQWFRLFPFGPVLRVFTERGRSIEAISISIACFSTITKQLCPLASCLDAMNQIRLGSEITHPHLRGMFYCPF